MNKIANISAVSLLVVGVSVAGTASAGWWGDKGDHCKRGGDYAGDGMMMKGRYGGMIAEDLDLSPEEAKTLVQARLIMKGNDRLKTGQVTEKDGDTYLVDVVTVDDSLVRQVEVDRNLGLSPGRFDGKR